MVMDNITSFVEFLPDKQKNQSAKPVCTCIWYTVTSISADGGVNFDL